MFRLLQPVLLALTVVPFLGGLATGQLQFNGRNGQSVGKFSEAAGILAAEVPIVLNGNRLDLNLPERDKAFVACREIVGGNGGGGSSTSGNMWSCNSNNGKFRAEMANSFEFGNFVSADRLPGKSVFLNGLEYPLARTSIRQSPEQLLAFHLDTANSRVFWMKGTGTEVVLVDLNGATARSWKGESWEQINSSHDLIGLCNGLMDVGINLPAAAPWQEVATLIRELIVFPESGWEEFMQEFAGLNSAKFEDRDTASARLAKETGKWKVAIAWGLISPKTPPEVKARLRGAIAVDLDSSANHLIHSVTTGKLHQSPWALIRVLDSGKDRPEENGAVYSRLREVTGEAFGDELQIWKNWLAKSEGEPGAVAADEMLDEAAAATVAGEDDDAGFKTASFDSAKTGLSMLLAITVDGQGRWVLDRDSWRTHFGGRDAEDLVGELKSVFDKSGLPPSWLNIGNGHDPELIGFPQILFEKYTESLSQVFATPQENQMAQIRMQQQRNRTFGLSSQKTLNRQFEMPGLKVQLTMHAGQQADRGKLAGDFFELEVSEDKGPGRMIHFREEQDGSLKLFCMGAGQKQILGLGQNQDGECWIHLIDSGNVTTHRAESAISLLSTNREWFDGEVKPLFAELGIGLGVAAGGPLQIVDQGPIE